MEICEHPAYHAKFTPGRDEKLRFARMPAELSTFRDLRAMFQRADGRCPDGNYTAVFSHRSIHSLRRLFRQCVTFGVQMNVRCLFHANRLKRSQANVQGQADNFHATRPDCLEHLGSKVEACGRSRHGSTFRRKDGLVAFSIGRFILAMNIWR